MRDIGDLYECAVCHGTFAKTISDEEARAEARSLFPAEDLEDTGVVCDDCFHKVMAWARQNMPEHLL